MRFNPTPVIDALKDVLPIFVDLQFDPRQTPVMTECQQIDGPRASQPAVRRTKLRMQRRDD